MYEKWVCKIVVMANLVVSSILFINNPSTAEDLSFFAPGDDVNFHITRAIGGVSDSLDMAVSSIELMDIADAIVAAKNRGVAVRILFTAKDELAGSGSSLRYFVDNGVEAWILEDEDVSINNFVIFDKKLLLVGSFNMGRKPIYQNATFTDDRDSLYQYQSQFDGFANLRLASAASFLASGMQPGRSGQLQSGLTGQGRHGLEQHTPPDNRPLSTQIVNLSFDDMNRIFGKGSSVGKSEQKRLWKEYKGKYVTWTGNITYVAWGIMTGDIMGVRHPNGREVTVYLKKAYVTHVKRLHKGDLVTYRGRLDRKPRWMTGFKVKDAEIIQR